MVHLEESTVETSHTLTYFASVYFGVFSFLFLKIPNILYETIATIEIAVEIRNRKNMAKKIIYPLLPGSRTVQNVMIQKGSRWFP